MSHVMASSVPTEKIITIKNTHVYDVKMKIFSYLEMILRFKYVNY